MKLRKIVQIIFFLLVATISVGHGLEESGIKIPLISTASLHAVCPLGGVVSVYEFFVSGKYVKKIHESSFILMFIVFGLAIIAGPLFCGWICPFGTFQEWISKIGKKIFKKNFNKFIPYKVDRYLRFIRYIVLVVVLIKTAQSAVLFFANYDPYYALFNIWSDEVAVSSYIVLGITVLMSLFIERPFCKYACPYGALLGITNIFKLFRITRKESTCINCNLCDKKCPMNIPLSKIKSSRDHQCISCLECTSEAACPKSNTMEMTFKGKVLKAKIIAPTIAILFILGIGGTMALNMWKTESSKTPVKYKTGEFAGMNNPSDIRGSYSLSDVQKAFDIPVNDIAKAFGLLEESNIEDFKIKDLEKKYSFDNNIEVGTDSVRLFVALYKGLPYVPEETTRLLRPAKSILKEKLSDDIIIDIPSTITTDNTASHNETISTDIKGNTTFKDALDMGFSKEQLEASIGGNLPKDKTMTIKDYAEENELEFSTIKEALQ